MKEPNFQLFMKCLMKAIENMDAHYFQLPVAGSDKPIYRERVYCYELYHQLRCALGNDFPYKLHGEVDKAGHPIVGNAKKPDFIVHKPGNMSNLVVIEVKPVTVKDRINELEDDFKTLKWFIDDANANYYRAIMLIYGNVNGDIPQNIRKEIEKVKDEQIIVIWHYEPNKKPKIIGGESYVA
jgi:hypothetical protein